MSQRLELTHSRGHLDISGRSPDVQEQKAAPAAVPGGVQEADDRAGSRGPSPAELAEEFEPTAQAIRAWVRQAALDAGDRQDGLTTDERAELRQLRKELKEVKMERDILTEAAAWFARETGSVPNGRTRS